MSTFALNYGVWTGVVGVILEYYKRRGYVKYSTLLTKGFLDKGLVGLISSYLQQQNVPMLGGGLDANYIYNGILGAASQMIRNEKGTSLQGAEEQILCALIGHRFAANFGNAFDSVTSNFSWVNNMFSGSSGYTGANIPNQGTPTPSTNSGNNNPSSI